MHDMSAFRCKCCGLHQASTAAMDRAGVPPMCPMRPTFDETIDDLAAREADHAAMYHHAMIDAQDEALLAQGERDHYHAKMQAAYSSREVLVQVLAQIDDLHHGAARRCSCGRRGCRVATLLADPRVSRLVRTYDEVRRTLRELRDANPDRWVEKWDYIDVSLVYPAAHRRRAGDGTAPPADQPQSSATESRSRRSLTSTCAMISRRAVGTSADNRASRMSRCSSSAAFGRRFDSW